MSATSTPQKAPLGDGQKFALGLAVTGMLAVGAYGLVISYWTVRELAVKLHMPLPHIFPVGIEGGMIAVLAIDIVLTWIGRPIGWLRQVARALSATAISINAYAGMEYGAAAVVMHALAPAILIVGVEALRHHLLVVLQVPEEREPIPRGRWLLAPVSSAAMGRRMVLWQQPRYTDALDTHLDRHEAIAELRRAFGWRWKRHIPAGLAYRLSVGVRLAESTAEVRALLAAHYARTEHTVSMMVAHEEQEDARLALDAHAWREPVRVRTGERTHTVVGGDHVNGHLDPGTRALLPVRCAPRARVQDAHARGDAAVAALRGWDADGARARITPAIPDVPPASRARAPRVQDDQPTPAPAHTDAHADAPQEEQDAHPGQGDTWIDAEAARGLRDIEEHVNRGDDGGRGARPAPAPDAPDAPTGAVRAAKTRGNESRARILAHLQEHPDAKPAEIAEEVGLSASQVRRHLRILTGEQP